MKKRKHVKHNLMPIDKNIDQSKENGQHNNKKRLFLTPFSVISRKASLPILDRHVMERENSFKLLPGIWHSI